MPILVKRKKPLPEKPVILTTPQGKLTRAGALVEARKKLGEMALISSDERLPRLVWVVGDFYATVGRALTWEGALARCRVSKKKEEIDHSVESREDKKLRKSFESFDRKVGA